MTFYVTLRNLTKSSADEDRDKKKIIQPEGRGKGRGRGAVPFIHNIVNIHSLYYMCFSLVFACLSVWGLDLRSLA